MKTTINVIRPDLAEPVKTPSRPATFGLGDAVAAVAQPIAGAIDAVLGTNVKGCGGCAGRKIVFNRIIPDLRHPLKREAQP